MTSHDCPKPGRGPSFTVLLAVLALLNAGWVNPLRPPAEGLDADTLSAGSRHMGQLFAERRQPGRDSIDIDLADPAQYQFVMDRLNASGKTPRNSARLFERLSQARARALARQEGLQASALTAPGWGCDHQVLLNGETRSGSQLFYSNPVATCLGGATYVYTDVVAYDANADGSSRITLASDSGEEYGGGRYFDAVLVEPTMPLQPARTYIADSMMIAVNEATGQETTTFAMVQTTAALVIPAQPMEHPKAGPGSPGGVAAPIKSCQLRGENDCDYALVSPMSGQLVAYGQSRRGMALRRTPTSLTDAVTMWTGDLSAFFPFDSGTSFNPALVYVPTRLSFSLPSTCTVTSIEPASTMRLTKRVSGGACVAASSLQTELSSRLLGNYSMSLNKLMVLSSAYSIPESTNCTYAGIQDEDVYYTLTFSVKASCSGKTETITYTYPRGGRVALKVMNSCLAAGTRVAKADGTQVPVEEVRVGDRVVSNATGRVLTVTRLAQGGEDKPLVKLRDNQGHQVRLTERHPVVLASGKVVPAVEVKVKDRVRTRRGVASIVSVERVPYEGRVYNLRLGTEQELARLEDGQSTLYADGFLVGDIAMQEALGQPTPAPVDVLASLPESWHHDFHQRVRVSQARH